MKTKEKIWRTAVDQFNQFGTSAVSTNHIAEAAGISPGNLYYHYRNKTEIILAILDEMYAEWTPIWVFSTHESITQQLLKERMNRNFELLWQFRFFYREAVALFVADDALKQKHREMTEQRLVQQQQFVQRFVEEGVLLPTLGPDHIQKLLTAGWIIANNWLVYLEMNGREVSPDHFHEGVELIWLILSPYLR